VTVSGSADEELVASCSAELALKLRPGDRVLCSGEFPCIVDRLPERGGSRHLLEQPPPIRFEDIGGLDHELEELRMDLDLHVLHPERVAAYDLRLGRGVLLVGQPGVGKTMIAGAMANYLLSHDPETRVLYVRPGELRGQLYGQTEKYIRELFASVRSAPGLVLLFLDEVDNFGTRGEGIGQEIDSRVLASLLSEMSGLDSPENVLMVAATNRLDLVDGAMARQGRLGDRIIHIPRPGREATGQILEKYLPDSLPYDDGVRDAGGAESLVELAVSYLHAPEGGAGLLATATLADARRCEIRASHVLSGALLASAIESAKHSAAHRALEGGTGIGQHDVLGALDKALEAEGRKLASPHVARRMLDFDGADQITRVELPAREPRTHGFVRAA
jgi:proteasome-associated ATPase